MKNIETWGNLQVTIKIYNTLTNKKEEFVPRDVDKVSMYVCGVTVYDECHLGHARAYVAFDIVRRYLEYKGFEVTYIQNFTDIDDKIIKRALEIRGDNNKTLKECAQELVEEHIESYFQVMDKLGIKRASLYPKATEHIKEMIEIIDALVKKGFAYESAGDVYFDVSSFKNYGKLSGRKLEDLKAGARVDINENKRNAFDFTLWKKAKENEPSWDSPWGEGRPGWHIECSAMSLKYLGSEFDIHGGGCDLIFPHHENEIMQSECYSEKPFAKYWMHNGFLTINKEKMSKSLSNFFTLSSIFRTYKPEVVRFFLVSAHYKTPIDFSGERLEEAKEQLERGYEMLKHIKQRFLQNKIDIINVSLEYTKFEDVKKEKDKFILAMDDDFNTPAAIACLFELVNLANNILLQKELSKEDIEKLVCIRVLFKEIADVLNIFQFEKSIISANTDCKNKKEQEIKDLVIKREKARLNKDWELADKTKQEIIDSGDNVKIEDTPAGTYVSGDFSVID
jgi:cysteinyl-tRNA synthetase